MINSNFFIYKKEYEFRHKTSFYVIWKLNSNNLISYWW
jgi:hypothetical protein